MRRVYEESGGGKEPAMGYIVGWLSADKNDGKPKSVLRMLPGPSFLMNL